jgi:2-polyprenyl-6-methoxyphenol hydroxylase-like FAD-dependent oxidoreductase
MSTDSKRHVAVIGGGLTGVLAAIYFAKRDWVVSLFELRKGSLKLQLFAHVKTKYDNYLINF